MYTSFATRLNDPNNIVFLDEMLFLLSAFVSVRSRDLYKHSAFLNEYDGFTAATRKLTSCAISR